jgi:hypothetical protein
MSVVKTIETITEVTKKLGLAKQAEQAIDNANTTQKVINSGLTASSALGAAAITAGAATTEVAANTAVAGSGAAASVAEVPIVGPILAVAAVGSVLAMLASSLPKFANGGIVQGGSISGDKILARVNAGEMILNQGQQSNLFALLNGKGGINSTSSGIGGTVEFKIDGKNLKGVLSNYDKIKSKA